MLREAPRRVALSIAPDTLMAVMALVFVRLTHKDRDDGVEMPLRTSILSPNYTTLFMPARLAEFGSAIKVVSVPRGDVDTGIPATTVVMDDITGGVKAVVNARRLTALRTAAGSVLATRLIGPAEPQFLVIFGAGSQCDAHVDILTRTFPSVMQCVIVNRSKNKRLTTLVSSLKLRFPRVLFVAESAKDGVGLDGFDLRLAVQSADVICTATSSTRPLFQADWVKSGAHLNLVGSYTPQMREVDVNMISRAGKVLVDSRDACLKEAGELTDAGSSVNDLVEIGQVVEVNGRGVKDEIKKVKDAGDISIFKSVGIGLQDTAMARIIVDTAISNAIGTYIEYDTRP